MTTPRDAALSERKAWSSTASADELAALANALPAAERLQLLDYWQERADGEWTTAHGLGHVRDDLLALNAPPALLALADGAISDELCHTDWCLRLAEALGGTRRQPRLRGYRPLTIPGASAAENRLLRPVFAGCLSETIAVHVLRESQRAIRPKALRAANRRHLSEEVRHARLGWAFLAFITQDAAAAPAARRSIERALPLLVQLADHVWRRELPTETHGLETLGLLTREHIERGLERATIDVMIPGFEHHGVAFPRST